MSSFVLLVALAACGPARPAPDTARAPKAEASITLRGATWKKLETTPYKGKQDDIFFTDPDHGFYVNGGGLIYKTADGGKTWTEKLKQPGTYFRAVGFANERHGFAGNLGPDYFPGVTDFTALYETEDGGDSWHPSTAASAKLPKGAGVCAIDVLKNKFINAGHLDERTIIHVAGRVGGPAYMLRSVDEGRSWTSIDMNAWTSMVLDVKFFDANTGIVAGASDGEIEKSHARILRTTDSGKSWTKVYESARPFENTWKVSFPTPETGYVTIQNYDEDPKNVRRYVAKTTDGGKTWRELPLVDDHEQSEFGVAFASADVGWVGARKGGYETLDGGKTWRFVDMGRAVNKIRLLPIPGHPRDLVGYAIGVDVFKLDTRER